MSVTTTADEKLSKTKEALREAYKNMLEFLDENTWGHSDWKDDYIQKMYEVAAEILRLKNKIG